MSVTNIATNDIPSKNQATSDFLDWLNTKFPGAKESILTQVDASNLGADNVGPNAPISVPWYQKVLDAAQQIIPAYAQYKTQKEIVDLQMTRARAGLPPIDASMYTAPPVRVQYDASNIVQSISPQTKTLLWVGGGLIAAIFLLPLLTGGRR